MYTHETKIYICAGVRKTTDTLVLWEQTRWWFGKLIAWCANSGIGTHFTREIVVGRKRSGFEFNQYDTARVLNYVSKMAEGAKTTVKFPEQEYMKKFNNTTTRSLTGEGNLTEEIAQKVQFLSGMERVLQGSQRSYMAIIFDEKGTGIENGIQYQYEEDNEEATERVFITEGEPEEESEEESEEEEEEEDEEENVVYTSLFRLLIQLLNLLLFLCIS